MSKDLGMKKECDKFSKEKPDGLIASHLDESLKEYNELMRALNLGEEVLAAEFGDEQKQALRESIYTLDDHQPERTEPENIRLEIITQPVTPPKGRIYLPLVASIALLVFATVWFFPTETPAPEIATVESNSIAEPPSGEVATAKIVLPFNESDATDIHNNKITSLQVADHINENPARVLNTDGGSRQSNQNPNIAFPENYQGEEDVAYVDTTPNKSLENNLGARRTRSEFSYKELRSPEAVLQINQQGKVAFSLLSEIRSVEDISDGDFILKIYNNDRTHFRNDWVQLEQPLSPVKNGQDISQVAFNANIPLKPGLYYYLILDKMSDDYCFTGKFLVKPASKF